MGTDIQFRVGHDEREWDALVAASPGATAFHDWSWLRMQTDLHGWRFEPLVVEHRGRAVGVFPVLLRSPRRARPADPPFPFVGPLVPEALLASTLRQFRRWQLVHRVPVVRFDFGPGVAAAGEAALVGNGSEWSADRTFVIDLVGSSPESLVAGMKRGARQALRAAGRHAVEVRPALPDEVTTLLPRVLSESYESRGVPSPYPSEIGERVARWAADRSDVYLSTALVAGEPVGVLVALGSHEVVTGWAGGTLRAHRAVNPSTVLYHDMLQWSLARGHSAVDLVGYVDLGVSRFKMSLGAVERPYVNAVSSPVPRFVRSAVARVRDRGTAAGPR
ncbi:GNAT family N-acetyltransferase [Curtobacterium sp. MCBD17_040]|uniref:lipid II:glycine glycyltransferase FemX n=1 Tax=Curtobacterium sp. MCBD17_040 TaxID=2175674 RepID=UPI0015E8E3BB|nr:GNAT family N-acetyltransferase [Curtobacterium sp. MCBD17_040]WIB64874.1 GNAT family N-acetyltransferase [Curtobacterium sp. MCBD17_040]